MTRDALSDTMRSALRAAVSDAGLWLHRDHAGYYVPGLGTVPYTRRTIQALERRSLVTIAEAALDHEAVYAEVVLRPGTIASRVVATQEGRVALER